MNEFNGYQLYPQMGMKQKEIPFYVEEENNSIPKEHFNEESWISQQSYSALKAVSIASTLGEIAGESWYRRNDHHIVYPFEVAANYVRDPFLPELGLAIGSIINKESDLKITEIGGQEGRYLSALFRYIPKNATGTIIDLDITRRDPAISLLNDGYTKCIHHIQADAHRLTNIFLENNLPQQNCICMVNTLAYLFDPIYVLSQAWDALTPGGLLVLGGLGSLPVLPFWVETKNPLFNANIYYEEGDIYNLNRFLETYQRRENEIRPSSQAYTNSIPRPFTYDSQNKNNHEIIDPIFKAYQNLSQARIFFSFGKVLKFFQIPFIERKLSVNEIFNNKANLASIAYYIIKKENNYEGNPFQASLWPISGPVKGVQHDEIFVTQICRKLTIPEQWITIQTSN